MALKCLKCGKRYEREGALQNHESSCKSTRAYNFAQYGMKRSAAGDDKHTLNFKRTRVDATKLPRAELEIALRSALARSKTQPKQHQPSGHDAESGDAIFVSLPC
jgi:hypothetical protein